jgi:hypothetical protein
MPKMFILRHLCILSLIFFLNVKNSLAQDSTLRYNVVVMASGSTGQTPFWGYANKQGEVPLTGNFVMGKWGISKVYNPANPRIVQWSGGAELVASYAKKENVFFSDLYLAGKLGPLELLAGQKNSVTGIIDTTLSSGSLSMSGNARPFPRIQLSIPEFLPLPFTGNYVSVKASYSDGLLGNNQLIYGQVQYTPKTYLHQKTLYFRLGLPDERLAVYLGLNHQAVWGGEKRIWPAENMSSTDSYWHTITGKAALFKRVGLHFGTYDLGAEWKGLNWSYFVYRQNMYESGQLFNPANFSDGLNGLRIRRSNPLSESAKYFALQSLVFEFVGTKNQINSAPFFDLGIFSKGNFYNSYIYQAGYSYRNFGLGTPLVPNQLNTDGKLPVSKVQYSNNNRLLAFHAAASATWLGASFVFKGTYSMNYGTYLTPFEKQTTQISVSLSAEKKMSLFRGTYVFSGITADYGALYPNATALFLGLRKKGLLH